MSSPRSLDDWLYHIERVHFRSIDLSLDRVRRVAHVLRLPAPVPAIAVAGTNGKGSSVACLEAVYRAAGYRVGAYTSPHLVRYNERVRLDGLPVDDAALVDAFAAVEHARAGIPLTYFEFGTLAALVVFARVAPDVVILEVGMGGRLDAVNLVDAEVALITGIGLDHQQWLGDTVEKIAREKAGILRYQGRAVSSGRRPPAVLAQVAAARHCRLWQLGVDYDVEVVGGCWRWHRAAAGDEAVIDDLPLPLGGDHQLCNAAGAVAAVRQLHGRLPVSTRALAEGLAAARMPGRLQVVDGVPSMLLDVSHNADGLAVLGQWLEDHPGPGRNLAVFSMLADKDIDAALGHVGGDFDHWYVAPLDNPRSAGADALAGAVVRASRAPVDTFATMPDAVDAARAAAGADDRVVVFGSFYAVGDIMRHLHLDPYPASS